MKSERNNYGIRNPDGITRERYGESRTTYANDGRRFVRETPLDKQREISRQAEEFDPEKTRIARTSSAGQPAAGNLSDLQSVADQSLAASSTATSAASATASATAAATGTASGAAAGAATVAAAATSGAVAVAGTVAATVATAVIVVAVFVSTLAINLSLLLAGMTSLIFRVEMTGVQDEDFATPIMASITDGEGFYEEQEIFRDTLVLSFLDLAPGTEYTVTVKNEETIFFEKSYVTATEEVERGFLSAYNEENEIFVIVEGVILLGNERYTVTAKDERGNTVFARDGVDDFAEYRFTLDEPKNLFFTLLVGGKIAAVAELRIEREPEWEYDFNTAEWTWEDGFRTAFVSFAETHGYDPLILTAQVEEQIITPLTCESDGEFLYIARVLWDGVEYSDEKNVTLPATGHDYQPDWEWEMNVDGWYSEDGATLFFVCSHDETHRYKATVATVEEDRDRYVEATCDTPAESIYVATAVWNGETYTDEQPVIWEYSVLGHDFTEDPYSFTEEELAEHITLTQNENGEIVAATLTLHCARCDRDVTMNASEIEVMSSGQENLCEDGGTAEYYVFWGENGLEYAIYPYPTVEVGPIGHDYYEEPYYEWDEEEYASATAVFTCRHDSEHEERVAMDLTSEYFSATCVDGAYTLYTATVIFGGVPYTDTRRVDDPENPALEHDFPDPHEDDEDDDSDGVVFEYQYDGTGAIIGATMYLTCARCGLTFVYEADEIELMSPEPDLCNGETVEYYVFWGEFELSMYPTAMLVGQGHEYPDPEDVDGSNFEWSPDGNGGYTANLLLICSRNPDHIETVPATVTKGEGNTYHAEATFGGVTYSGDYTDPTGTGG